MLVCSLPLDGLSPQDIAPILCQDEAPSIIDVCLPADAQAFGRLILGSSVLPFDAVPATASAILVCAQGKKLSQGAAARIRAQGGRATHLIGGLEAWIAQSLPTYRRDIANDTALYCASDTQFAQAAFLRWFVDRVLPPNSLLMTTAEGVTADVADRFHATLLHGPAEALDLFGIDDLRMVQVAQHAEDGTLAALLHGIARVRGTDETGQRAAAPVFDAAYAGAQR